MLSEGSREEHMVLKPSHINNEPTSGAVEISQIITPPL